LFSAFITFHNPLQYRKAEKVKMRRAGIPKTDRFIMGTTQVKPASIPLSSGQAIIEPASPPWQGDVL